jgi:hypothetical protein
MRAVSSYGFALSVAAAPALFNAWFSSGLIAVINAATP